MPVIKPKKSKIREVRFFEPTIEPREYRRYTLKSCEVTLDWWDMNIGTFVPRKLFVSEARGKQFEEQVQT